MESQFHQNLRQSGGQSVDHLQKPHDHAKVPEYVQSQVNLLKNTYAANQNQYEETHEVNLAGERPEQTVKTYETFGRKLVTPNPKHAPAFESDF